MGKGSNKQDMTGRVYREFSRQKYNKYKHQYPKMRESEIVSKIIREWDALSTQARETLQNKYQHYHALAPEDVSDSETPKKTQTKRPELSTTPSRKEEQLDEHKEEQPKLLNFGEAAKEERVSKLEDKRDGVKAKKKQANSAYLLFFKHYLEKYMREHPNWDKKQIQAIIRLLWKTRKQKIKATVQSLPSKKAERTQRNMSGKGLFRKIKNLNNSQCQQIWRRMPRESRNVWNQQARCSERSERQSEVAESREFTLSLKNHQPRCEASLFSFMHKTM